MPAPKQANPLDQLRDIHLPDPVGIWPLAPGWWILIALALLIITIVSVIVYRRYQSNAYRRDAAVVLAEINQLRLNGQHSLYLQQLNQLLKQTALAISDRKEISSLSGMDWLRFLDNSANCSEFTNGVGRILEDGQYRPTVQAEDLSTLQQLAERWIREHQAIC